MITEEKKYLAISEQDLFDTEIVNNKLFDESGELGIVDFINNISFHKRFLKDSVELISKYSVEGAFPIISLSNYFDSVSLDFKCYISDESGMTVRHMKSLIDMKTDMFLQENSLMEISNPDRFRDLCFLYIIYKAKDKFGKKNNPLPASEKNEKILAKEEAKQYTSAPVLVAKENNSTETKKLFLRNFLSENKVNIEEYIASLGYISIAITSCGVKSEILMGFIGHLEDIAGIIAEIIAETSNDVETNKLTEAFRELIEGHLDLKKINKEVLNDEFYNHCIRIIIYKIKIREGGIETSVQVKHDETISHRIEEPGTRIPRKASPAKPDLEPEDEEIKKTGRSFAWFVLGFSVILLVYLGINTYNYVYDNKHNEAQIETIQPDALGLYQPGQEIEL